MSLLRRGAAPAEAQPWGTGKLAALLIGGVAMLALVAVGIGLAVYYTVTGDPDGTKAGGPAAVPATAGSTTASAPSGSQNGGGNPYGYDAAAADELARRPMPAVPFAAAQPGAISTELAEVMDIPRPTRVGADGVPTGFPQTPAGALGQLASISQKAMQTGSIEGVRSVIAQWAVPGGPTPGNYSGTQAMADLLSSAGLSASGGGQMTLSVTPTMGLVKGAVGDTFVVPCVDYIFVATIQATARVAAADCQRMVWTDGRWMIGPGAEPATAPSVWPGTQLAIEVGYRSLRYV